MGMQNLTKIILCFELNEQHVPKAHIATKLGVNRDTIYQWLGGIEANSQGLMGYLDSYSQAKKGPRLKRQVDPSLKRRVWEIRDREMECCGQKIQYFLFKEYGLSPAVSKIYEILAEKYVIKSKWKKNQARGPIPEAAKPREVIQMDTIDFGDIFAFTAVDIFSREADVVLRPGLTSQDGAAFLELTMTRRFNGFSELIQADGGPEFKDEFRETVINYTNRFRVSRPYKKNEQAFIESFNRTVRKECLGWGDYQASEIPKLLPVVEQFLNRYHYHRPHLGLGMKPPLPD